LNIIFRLVDFSTVSPDGNSFRQGCLVTETGFYLNPFDVRTLEKAFRQRIPCPTLQFFLFINYIIALIMTTQCWQNCNTCKQKNIVVYGII